jgi:hypothetical protein
MVRRRKHAEVKILALKEKAFTCMEAMEKLWAKRAKAEQMREVKKKELNDERLAVGTRRLEMKQHVKNRKLDLMQREIELKQRS